MAGVETYRITVGDGRSTEALVAAGGYGYAHSAIISENFPVRPASARALRDIVLVHFGRELTAAAALNEAARRGLRPPTYEDALYLGIQHPASSAVAPSCSFTIPGSVTSAVAMCFASGRTPDGGSWASRTSTAGGAAITASRSHSRHLPRRKAGHDGAVLQP